MGSKGTLSAESAWMACLSEGLGVHGEKACPIIQ